ncbi:MFS transporter [Nocardiopsis sp. HNM0947]|uniref:MFS transporter n=1 Tax=Nocardiopsis coralli TaxID=2772213 RepID=A0ABR9P288_9ACTN|nr:MFS transporter [Nocardiopsis coralli]MBE2997915.1 MFS transporter [Nocardiopsis coralli]
MAPCREGVQGTGTPVQAARGMPVLLTVTFLAFANYAALLSVVPLWAAAGGAGGIGVGATTGTMMAATVAAELAMPWLFRVMDLRTMMALGALLLGAPTPLYVLSSDLTAVLLVTVVRGTGFALLVTSGATLVADLARSGRLARSASLYGAAAALPNLGALAGGVWAAQVWGFDAVFWIGGAASVAAALLALALPRGHRGTFSLGRPGDLRAIAGPVSLFLLTAGAFGALTSFLPVAGPSAGEAALALFAASVALVAARLGAGSFADRHGFGRLLFWAVLACASGFGLLALALTGPPWLLVAGAALLGGGFGAAQNDSFVMTVQRLGTERAGTAGTLWNIVYDGGLGVGAVALGLVVGPAGYAGAFLAAGAAVAAAGTALALVSRPGADRAGLAH